MVQVFSWFVLRCTFGVRQSVIWVVRHEAPQRPFAGMTMNFLKNLFGLKRLRLLTLRYFGIGTLCLG